LSLLQPTGKRVTGGGDGGSGRIVWLPLRPGAGFVKAAGKEMRKPRPRVHMVGGWIEGTEAHGVGQVVDRNIRLA